MLQFKATKTYTHAHTHRHSSITHRNEGEDQAVFILSTSSQMKERE